MDRILNIFSKNGFKRITYCLVIIMLYSCTSGCILTVPYPAPIPCGATEELIKAIEYANTDPTTLDVIELESGCDYEISAVYDAGPGNTGLPSVTTPVKIVGNGSRIVRAGGPNDIKFRIFHIGPTGDLTLSNLRLENGYAYDPVNYNVAANNSGGAARNQGQFNLDQVIIQKNNAVGVAGGVYNEGGLVILDTAIRENEQDATVYTMGGATAIHNKLGSSGVMYRSTVNTNGQNGMWNAISIDENASFYIENSTISNNSGTGINNDGNLDLMYVTITGNNLGIWSVWYGIPKINMTGTLFQNTNDCSIGSGVLVSNYYNMDSDGSCGVMYTVSPSAMQLGPLADNGGSTQTHALLPGSPAIDAVTGPASRVCPILEDQRGTPRPQISFCDIGAYEHLGSNLSPANTQTNQLAPLITDTPTPTATDTPTPEPETSRCDLFESENASLTMHDIPYGTTNLTLYVQWPHPVWGLEEMVEIDEGEWFYEAALGSTPAHSCAYEGYSGRLYCYFVLPEAAIGASLVLNVYLDGCREAIFTHEQVSIFEPLPSCSADLSPEACREAGGTYSTREGRCTCP